MTDNSSIIKSNLPSTNNISLNNNASITIDILLIFLAAELAISKENKAPWLIEEKLNKRRSVLSFDHHLQQMIMYVKTVGNYYAHCIECGNTSLYKTELRTTDNYFLHFNHSFNPCAQYNKKYIDANIDVNDPKFAYFYYHLNKSKDKIVSLKLVIPSSNICSPVLKAIDLSEALHSLRIALLSTNDDINPSNMLEQIKNNKSIS